MTQCANDTITFSVPWHSLIIDYILIRVYLVPAWQNSCIGFESLNWIGNRTGRITMSAKVNLWWLLKYCLNGFYLLFPQACVHGPCVNCGAVLHLYPLVRWCRQWRPLLVSCRAFKNRAAFQLCVYFFGSRDIYRIYIYVLKQTQKIWVFSRTAIVESIKVLNCKNQTYK